MIVCPSPAYFLADCHLPLIPSEETGEWTSRVVRFLRTEGERAASLFLVGDVFDFWFEWKYSVPTGVFPILSALHELVRQGKRVFFLAGNHDGHPGRFLSEEVGITVSRREIDAEIDGKRFHIIHGDGIAKGDRGYRILRSLVRWGPTEKIYRLIHPDLGIWLAARLSSASYRLVSAADKFGPNPYRDYARRKLDGGFNFVVMGHRHKAEIVPHPNGAYLSVGEWIHSCSYGVFENGRAEIRRFNT